MITAHEPKAANRRLNARAHPGTDQSRRPFPVPSPQLLHSEPRTKNPELRPAFTLIELMVVIGIISLLVAIALPAFTSVRNRAKAVTTQQMIATLTIGIESYRTDSKNQGTLPMSVYPDANILNPHVPIPGSTINNLNYTVEGKQYPTAFGGANLLAWTLVGADLLGSPGFKDLDGDGAGRDAFGGWTNNVGRDADIPVGNTNATTNQLYTLKTDGTPFYPRSEKFVDIAKLKLPKIVLTGPTDQQPYFELSDLKTKPHLGSICFLDAWGSPILYYKANRGAPLMVDAGSVLSNCPPPTAASIDHYCPESQNGTSYQPSGMYNLRDNYLFTGYTGSSEGMDLGAGPHPMAKLGPSQDAGTASPPNIPTEADRGRFAYTVWNKSITATPHAYNDDSYILIAPGVDGLWGTGDDILNIPNNLTN